MDVRHGRISRESPRSLPHARIAAEFEHCMQYFQSLCSAMQANGSTWSTKIALMSEYRKALIDWGRTTGASGRSLDHTLRRNSRLRDQVLELLEEFNAVLQSILDDVQMTAVPLLSPAMVEVSSGSYFDIISGSNVGLQTFVVSEQDLQSKLEVISTNLDRLHRLITSLEHPFPRDIYLPGVLDQDESKDILLASKVFPRAPPTLKERIGRANWHRRCFLRKVTKQIEKERKSQGQSAMSPLEVDQTSMSAPLSRNSRPQAQQGYSMAEHRSIFSRTASTSETMSNSGTTYSREEAASEYTVATSVTDAEEPIRLRRSTVPDPPVPLVKNTMFQCPYCAQDILVGDSDDTRARDWTDSADEDNDPLATQLSDTIPFEETVRAKVMEVVTTSDWSRHVYADLEPYICTFDDCSQAQLTFATVDQWSQHEKDIHRTSKIWICQSCDQIWHQQEAFEDHLHATHSLPPDQLSMVAMLCEKDSDSRSTEMFCRLCMFKCTTLESLNSHTAQHLEHLALDAIEGDEVSISDHRPYSAQDQTRPSQFARNLAWVESLVAEHTPFPFKEDRGNGSSPRIRPQEAMNDLTKSERETRNRPSMGQRGPSYTYQIRAREQKVGHAERIASDPQRASIGKATRTLPPQRNADFVGRITDMAHMHAALAKPGGICILSGVGGLGKSALATEYTYRFETAYSYIFWVQAETPMICADTYSQIALSVVAQSKGQTEERLVTLSREFLETTPSRWLLVFDNVDQWLRLQRFLPIDMSKVSGSVLITTQLQNLQLSAMSLQYIKIDLNVLSLEESRRLLLSSANLGHNSSDLKAHPEYKLAGDIAKMAARLPLALSLIAGFVLVSDCSLAEFAELWRERQEDLQATAEDAVAKSSDAEQAMETAWNIGLRAVTTDARELLNILAFLDSETIQKSLLVGEHDSHLLRFLHVSQPGRYRRMTTELRRRRLISVETRDGEEVLSVHRKLQARILQELSTEGNESLREKVFNQVFLLIRVRFPSASPVQVPEPEKWPLCRKYLPHVLSIRRLALGTVVEIPPSVELAKLFSDGGINLWERGMTNEGLELLKAAESMIDLLQVEEELLRANIHVIASLLLQDAGMTHIAECKDRGWTALQTRIEYHKTCAPSDYTRNDEILLYNAWADHACILLQYNDIVQAEPIFDRCLEKYRSWGSPEEIPYEYAKYFHHKAFCQMYRGSFAEAVSFAKQGLHWVEVATGATSAASSRWKFDLACVVFQSGDLNKALELHNEILAMRTKLHGKYGFPTLQSLYAVAATQSTMGDLVQAETNLRQILEIEVSRPGTCSEAALARTQFHLSQILSQQKDDVSTEKESTITTTDIGQATLAAEVGEIEQLLQTATKVLRKPHPLGSLEDGRHIPKESELACFDYQQPVFDGRFTGLSLLQYLANKDGATQDD